MFRYLQKKTGAPLLVYIFGCQRSGTTLVVRIFKKDWRFKVFNEIGSPLSKKDTEHGMRLDPADEILFYLQQRRENRFVCKPLVESQHAGALLEAIPNSKALWIYRNYADVASSDMKKFGSNNGIFNLSSIVYQKPDWRNENISSSTRNLVEKEFSEDMNPSDAAGLFWYVRNILFFENNLDKNENCFLIRYEDLVSDTETACRALYSHLRIPFPKGSFRTEAHTRSIGKGKTISLSPHLDELCRDLYERLESQYEKKLSSLVPRLDRVQAV